MAQNRSTMDALDRLAGQLRSFSADSTAPQADGALSAMDALGQMLEEFDDTLSSPQPLGSLTNVSSPHAVPSPMVEKHERLMRDTDAATEAAKDAATDAVAGAENDSSVIEVGVCLVVCGVCVQCVYSWPSVCTDCCLYTHARFSIVLAVVCVCVCVFACACVCVHVYV